MACFLMETVPENQLERRSNGLLFSVEGTNGSFIVILGKSKERASKPLIMESRAVLAVERREGDRGGTHRSNFNDYALLSRRGFKKKVVKNSPILSLLNKK